VSTKRQNAVAVKAFPRRNPVFLLQSSHCQRQRYLKIVRRNRSMLACYLWWCPMVIVSRLKLRCGFSSSHFVVPSVLVCPIALQLNRPTNKLFYSPEKRIIEVMNATILLRIPVWFLEGCYSVLDLYFYAMRKDIAISLSYCCDRLSPPPPWTS